MCTVTIVPVPGSAAGGVPGWRMACSRDEKHERPAALPPRAMRIDDRDVVMPIDPGSGGTWVAVNDAGLALTLLNHNLPDPPSGRDLSRGSVIPQLIGAATIDEVLELAIDIERERMLPFRLVGCDGGSVLLWRGIDPIVAAEVRPWSGTPAMFTSSGLGDHLVEAPRRELFNGWFGDDHASHADQQLAFHRHRWPGREHLSVCMSRADARTVSYSVVTVDQSRVSLAYHPDRPDREAGDELAILERRLVQR